MDTNRGKWEFWVSVHGGYCKEPHLFRDTPKEIYDIMVSRWGESRVREDYGIWFGVKDPNANVVGYDEFVGMVTQ